MTSSDFDLSQIAELSVNNVNHITHFFTNFAFEDSVELCSNVKFPGTMVVSLQKKDLHLFNGFKMHHACYEGSQIAKWIISETVAIPICLGFPEVFFHKLTKLEPIGFQSQEFANSDGYFEPHVNFYISNEEIVF